MTDLSTYWKDLPDESTPFEATFLNAWGVALKAVADAAALPADATVAGFVTGASATKTALNGIYAPLASPTFTGTVAGVTKTAVGLGNVDNTPDASTPVSTAQAAAIAAAIPTTGAGSTMGTPVSTATNGTVTSGTTETLDAVLGTYTFTAVASRRYRAILDGALVNTTVANDWVGVRIRNGGGSTPTATSTLVAASQTSVGATGGGGQPGLQVANTFVPGAGTVTLGVFVVRLIGSGVELIASAALARQLYAVDMGPA